MPSSRPRRRRQRSVRVTVATVLLGAAALVVLLALPTRSPLLLSGSSVLALLCGAAATRIVHTELAQSRRGHAADRAAQAAAYRTMFAERASAQAEFATAMTERLAERDRTLSGLETALALEQKRAAEAEQRVRREARRANEAAEQVAELQQALLVRRAEEADELASWEAGSEPDTVVDLLAWEGRAGAGSTGAGLKQA
jgi:hypothetical protein